MILSEKRGRLVPLRKPHARLREVYDGPCVMFEGAVGCTKITAWGGWNGNWTATLVASA